METEENALAQAQQYMDIKMQNMSAHEYIYKDGTYYGSVGNNLPEGHGFFVNDKYTYTGEWKKGKISGRGILIYIDRDEFHGEFLDGMEVNGKKTYINGDTYDGLWKDRLREGMGRYRWISGDTYEGEWAGGYFKGHGIYTWNDGRVYNGHWQSHQQELQGMHLWPDGSFYNGSWKKGKRHGFGEMTWSDNTHVRENEDIKRWDHFFELSFEGQRSFVKQFLEQQHETDNLIENEYGTNEVIEITI
jgi:hypothetical protein